ncbi:MAG: hypothetical protein JRJ45_00195 [Deltaproteobacteria bacterium]|nr:hypothetical protein [Deltaproteobacteria bacterium]
MRNQFLILLVLACVFMAGCSLIDATAPINPETGYREATQITKDVADAVPYGSGALAAILFVSNAFIFLGKKKSDKGLWATIKAIEAASKDPEMSEMVAKLKIQLAAAHKDVNVQPLINRLLSRIKFG